jgi:hypothetical protein
MLTLQDKYIHGRKFENVVCAALLPRRRPGLYELTKTYTRYAIISPALLSSATHTKR